jgi:hypothetical protein
VNNTSLWLNHVSTNPIIFRAPLVQTFGIYLALGVPFSTSGRNEAVLVFLDYTPRDENQNIAYRLVEIFKAIVCRVEDTLHGIQVPLQYRKASFNRNLRLVCKSRVIWQGVHLVQEKIHLSRG